jgi:signal transduction histidine kinase/CheY-like chemotaxis protein
MRAAPSRRRRRSIAAATGLAALAAVAGVYAAARPGVDFARVHRIGYNHNPPFQIHHPGAPPTGFAVETVARAAERAGMRLEWVYDPRSDLDALRRGEAELWPILSDLVERRSWVYVSDAWMISDNFLITRGATPLPPADYPGEIAYAGPALMQTLVRRNWPAARPRSYPAAGPMAQSLCDGELPFVLATSHQATTFLREVGVRCGTLEVRTQYLTGLSTRLGVGALPAMAPAADRLQEEIVAMGADGELGAILAKYSYVGLTEARVILLLVEAERQRRALTWALTGLAGALAVLTVFAWRLRRARAAADAANVAKSDFLANMSHEIRTPLGGVLGMIELALDGPLAPAQRERLDTAHSSARTLLALLNDVLDLSRIEARRLELAPIDFQPRTLVDEIAALMAPVAHAKGLSFERLVDADVPTWIKADPVRVRQVLLNLIGNAIKFTERGGVTVRIALEGGDPHVLRIAVRDTGIGVPADKHTAIFEPFRQADGSVVRKFGGTGLGLAISRQLVEMMGGRIWFESQPGTGSVFLCTLRVASADPLAGVSPAADAADSLPARQLQVLVAEDNPVNQRLVRAMLEKDQHAVTIVDSGHGAVDAVRAGAAFDLVLMDIQMPEMDGFQATAAIRALESRQRAVPIVALTAHAQVGYDAICREAGMSGYLSKPIDRAALRRVLARVAAGLDPSTALPAA